MKVCASIALVDGGSALEWMQVPLTELSSWIKAFETALNKQKK